MEDCVVRLERDPRVEEAVLSMSTSIVSEEEGTFCFVCGMFTTRSRMGGPLRRHANYLRQVNSFMMAMREGGEADLFGGGQGTSCATCFVVIKHVFDIQQKIASLQKELQEIVKSTRRAKRNTVLSSQQSPSIDGDIYDAELQVKIEKDKYCVVRLERDARVEEVVMAISMSMSTISEEEGTFCFVCGMFTTKRRMGGPLRRRVCYLRQVNSFVMAMSEGGGTDLVVGDGGVNGTSCATCYVVIKHVFDIQQKIASLQKELEEIVQVTRMKTNMVLSSQQSPSTDSDIFDAELQVKIEKDEDEDNYEFQQSPDTNMESLPIKSVVGDDLDKEIGDDGDVQSCQWKRSGGNGRPKRNLNPKKKKEGGIVWDALSDEGMNQDNDDDYNDGDYKDDSCLDDPFKDDNDDDDIDECIPKSMKRKTKKTNESKIKRNVTKSLKKRKNSPRLPTKGQEESEQICDQCGKKCATQQKLNNHIQWMHSIRPHACTVCEKRFCSAYRLRRHIQFRHDVLNYMNSAAMEEEEFSTSCSTCGKKLSTYRNRIIHEIRVCHVTTWSEDELKKLSIILLTCTQPGCNLIFVRRDEFNRHSLTHTDPGLLAKIRRERREKRLPSTLAKKEARICHICGVTVVEGYLPYHISRIHLGVAKYPCVECGIKFFTRRELTKHTKAHVERRNANASGNDLRKDDGRCPYCAKDFLGSKLLRRHLKEEHGQEYGKEMSTKEINLGVRKYPCGECGIKFHSRKDVANHTKAHEGRRKAGGNDLGKDRGRCPHCAKDFLGTRLLKRHLKEEHDQENTEDELNNSSPLTLAKKETKICHICGVTVAKLHLPYHISRVHMKETKYQCGECGIKFFTRRDLTKHTKAHEERRNASRSDSRKDRGRCPYCSKDFLGLKLLRRHLREEHQENSREMTTKEISTEEIIPS